MIGPTNSKDVSDARLVAYIDGELSPDDNRIVAQALDQDAELRKRLEYLDSGGRRFGDAFNLLLEAAPEERLRAMFADLIKDDADAGADSPGRPASDETVVPLRRPARRGWSPVWQTAAAASFALTIFGGGIVIGVLYGPKEQQEQRITQRNWMDAVAQYVSLFSQETLAGMPADPATRQEGLRRVSAALGIDVTPDKVAGLPSLDFKGTQMLQLDGKPIAQIAFMSEAGKPVAICIIRTPRAPEPPSPDKRQGLNIVHWITGGYGYMVIGDLPQEEITRISAAARARLS